MFSIDPTKDFAHGEGDQHLSQIQINEVERKIVQEELKKIPGKIRYEILMCCFTSKSADIFSNIMRDLENQFGSIFLLQESSILNCSTDSTLVTGHSLIKRTITYDSCYVDTDDTPENREFFIELKRAAKLESPSTRIIITSYKIDVL